MPEPHGAAVPHCPQPLHVCTSAPEHCVAFGVHVDEPEQLHAPQEQPEVHCSVPYGFDEHACLVVGAHTPWPVHEPCTQPPSVPHVSVSVPQLPQATGFVCPGAHEPTQAPLTHVLLPHGVGVPHEVSVHVWTPLPEHCVWPMVHVPWHCPFTQVPLAHATPGPHWPHGSQVSTSAPEHCVPWGVHAGLEGQEHAPQVHEAVHDCVPYVLVGHVCAGLPGAHAPAPLQPASVHAPVALQVCVFVPQLPQGTGLVCPGAHVPVHTPSTHVWPEHAVDVPQVPAVHVCTPLPEHRTLPFLQGPASAPESAPDSPPPPLLLPEPELEPLAPSPVDASAPVS
jgi:hypothetical protein